MTKVILVRHGQTEWNRVERFRGQADVPLDKTGIAQAEATGKRISKQWNPAAVYASPLSRAVRTAEAISRHFDLAVQPVPGLIDINYGEWQGLSPEEARQRWPVEIENWFHHPEKAVLPGGETLFAARQRLFLAFKRLIESHPEDTIVIVGHTVSNRLVILETLGLGNDRFWALNQDTCAINVIQADAGSYKLICMNDTCHLLEGF